LKQLFAHLDDADWLDVEFSAGDLMVVSVLLRLKSSGILDEFPNLAAYVARAETRPAYKRAFALAVNTDQQGGTAMIGRGARCFSSSPASGWRWSG
jgi:glutathione S-transferase